MWGSKAWGGGQTWFTHGMSPWGSRSIGEARAWGAEAKPAGAQEQQDGEQSEGGKHQPDRKIERSVAGRGDNQGRKRKKVR